MENLPYHWAAIVENEVDYIFFYNISTNLAYICFYIIFGKTWLLSEHPNKLQSWRT